MELLWHVVEFADSSTAVVPTSWVQNGECLWPPNDSINLQKAVKNQIKPTLEWGVHKQIRCLATCDTYEKAIDCLKKSVEPDCATSDIESEVEKAKRRKRKSRPNPKYMNALTDSEEESSKKKTLPKPPPIISPDLYQNFRAAAQTLNSWPEDNYNGNQTQDYTHTSQYSDLQPQPRQLLREMGLSKIVQMLAEIKEDNKEIKEHLKKITHDMNTFRRDVVRQDTETTSPSVIKLPLKSMNELDQAEEILKNPEEHQKMVSCFATTGGHTQDAAVRRMMTHAFTNSLASQLNWAGKGHKRAFRDTALHDVMFAALQKQLPGSTLLNFEETIKKWLKYAPEREGGVPRRK